MPSALLLHFNSPHRDDAAMLLPVQRHEASLVQRLDSRIVAEMDVRSPRAWGVELTSVGQPLNEYTA
jgi:hypothetical protein